MATHTTSLTRTLAVAVTAVVTFGLLGCSAGTETAEAPSTPPAAVSTAPVAPTEEAEPTEEVIESETAPETSNSSLPADFPASVPLVSEKIERAKGHNNNGHGEWVVWVTVDDIAAAAVTARGQLTAAGFAEEEWHSSKEESKGVFKSADYGIVLVAIDTPHHSEFKYKVFTK